MLFNLDEKNLKVILNECATERTIVFVDYEAFAYGCMNQYRTEPNVSEWFRHLKGVGKIDEVLYFADWTEENIKNHVSRLRNFSTALIDCTKDSEQPRSKLRGIGLLLPSREVLNLFTCGPSRNTKASFCLRSWPTQE